MFFVYVLESITTGKIYTGQSEDLKRRVQEHNDPKNELSIYTKRNKGPWKLIYSEEVESRMKAVKREKFLKSGQGRKFIKKHRTFGASTKASSST